MKVTSKPLTQLHIVNPSKVQSAALKVLKDTLNKENISYSQTKDVQDLNMIFKIKDYKQMIIIDNSEGIAVNIHKQSQYCEVYIYPKKDQQSNYRHLPNAGQIIKHYRLMLSQTQSTNKIKLRSLCQSPQKKAIYKIILFHDTDETNQIFEQLQKAFKLLPFVKPFKIFNQIPQFKATEGQKLILITTLQGFESMAKKLYEMRISDYVDICVYGIKPSKNLLLENVILATDDYNTLIDFLVGKGFFLADLKNKLAYLKKRASSQSQSIQSKLNTALNEQNIKIPNPSKPVQIDQENERMKDKILVIPCLDEKDLKDSGQLLINSSPIFRNIKNNTEQQKYVQKETQTNQMHIPRLNQQKIQGQKIYISQQIQVIKNNFQSNYNSDYLTALQIKPDSERSITFSDEPTSQKQKNQNKIIDQSYHLISSIKKINSPIGTGKLINSSAIIHELSQQNQKSIEQSRHQANIPKANTNNTFKKTVSEKLSNLQVSSIEKQQQHKYSDEGQYLMQEKKRNSSISTYNYKDYYPQQKDNQQQLDKNQMESKNQNKKSKKVKLPTIIMEKIQETSEDRLNEENKYQIQTENRQSIIFRDQIIKNVQQNYQIQSATHILVPSFAMKSEKLMPNLKIIKGFSNYINQKDKHPYDRLHFNQSEAQVMEGNKDAVSSHATIMNSFYQQENPQTKHKQMTLNNDKQHQRSETNFEDKILNNRKLYTNQNKNQKTLSKETFYTKDSMASKSKDYLSGAQYFYDEKRFQPTQHSSRVVYSKSRFPAYQRPVQNRLNFPKTTIEQPFSPNPLILPPSPHA